MSLSDVSIKKPVFAWMIMAALLIFGGIGFLRMGVSQMPDIDFPYANISVTWEGAAPEVMETEVVDVIEESLMSIEGIKKITSTSRFGSASITGEFELSKDIDVAVQEIQTKIAQAQRNLPEDMDAPIIMKVNPDDQPIIWVGLSGDLPLREMVKYVKDHLKDQFAVIPDVGEITLGGFAEPSMRVWLDSGRLEELSLTAEDVMATIAAQHTELPAGRLTTEETERNIRVMGESKNVEELSRLVIPSRVREGYLWRTFRLSDISEVEDGLEDVRRKARVMGKPSVGMGIRKQRGTNAVVVAKRIKDRVKQLQPRLPEGMRLTVNYDGTEQINDTVHELEMTILLSVLLTGIVCWLFLGSFSSTVNVVLAIPTALGGAFIVMYFMGFTLNTVTLTALSMVVGIVVDDAIVVLENIARHYEMGKARVLAAIVGAREIGFAVMVISMALIAVFLPTAFMQGLIGKFFFQFGITVSAAVAFSLLEAVTLTPARCSQFLKVGHDTKVGRVVDAHMNRLRSLYARTLAKALHHKGKIVSLAVIFFAASLFLMPFLRKEMIPSHDISRFLVRIQMQPGSSLAVTDEALRKAEAFLSKRAELDIYFAVAGGSGMGGSDVNTGVVFVTLKRPHERPKDKTLGRTLTLKDFMQICRKEFNAIPGVMRATIQELSGAAGSGARDFPIDISIRGPDWHKLGELATLLMKKLSDSGLGVDLDTDYLVDIPEVHVIPDRIKASERGVTMDSIARTIQATMGGVKVAKYTEGDRRYDVRVSLTDENRRALENISNLWLRNQLGELVRLSDVTQVIETPQPMLISRENRQRAVHVFGNVARGKSQAKALELAEQIAKENFPEGYQAQMSGSAERFRETFDQLMFALWLGIFIAYMILAAQFNSFLHPLTILLALPFSVSGAFLGLLAMDHSLNMLSFIGLLLLMGIVKKNSILLVDFTNQKREEGLGVEEALMEACPLRLRPILMTTFAVMAAAVPAMMNLGPGAEQRAPMATVIIWGTAISTFLTLYVIPCVYSLVSRFELHRHEKEHREAIEILDSLAAAKAASAAR
ncbi:MAG: efflux RND transporter permease subunit [Candidatus Omnitrophica bacterium]|nr:efflux RND transporter permease subunit [Candidatus Omnitrophota bacterium]